MVYELINYFNSFNFFEITAKLLDLISIKNGLRYKLEETKICLFKKDYNKVIQLTNDIISHDKTQVEAYILCGNAFFLQNNLNTKKYLI